MVRALAIRLSNLIRYLGNQYGTRHLWIIFSHVLIHPASSGGEMLSNVVEKHLKGVRESKEDDNKPTVVYIGHLHSPYFLLDTRYGIRLACVKRVDQFHKTHALTPYIGMSISEISSLIRMAEDLPKLSWNTGITRPMVRKEEEKKTNYKYMPPRLRSFTPTQIWCGVLFKIIYVKIKQWKQKKN